MIAITILSQIDWFLPLPLQGICAELLLFALVLNNERIEGLFIFLINSVDISKAVPSPD